VRSNGPRGIVDWQLPIADLKKALRLGKYDWQLAIDDWK
jgi:hypothetical protein